jgi:ABC-type glycerol-3-phosphate transport system substrate-binding protein
MAAHRITRRTTLKAAAATAALPLVHVRTAGAAGKLLVASWDHWVPGANDTMQRLIQRWADANAVAVHVDFLSNVGNKIYLTMAAEALAKTGHDVFWGWGRQAFGHLRLGEPVDDIVARLVAQYGPLPPAFAVFGRDGGAWRAVPTSTGTLTAPAETRIDLFRAHVGLDLPAVFPPGPEMGPGYDEWTWDAFLVAAEKCAKAGVPFGLPVSSVNDAVLWSGALFSAFGAELVSAEGAITVRSDAVRAALDYAKRLAPFLPPDVYNWDDASNNRALISGRSALIVNPPSAWAVALRDNPQVGEQIWHHPLPAGPRGRFTPFFPAYWVVWEFSRNKPAAKALIEWLSQREQVAELCFASRGYDLPPFPSMSDFPVWSDEQPPKGTLFNYPIRAQHHAEPSLAGAPAPPATASQIAAEATIPKMMARVMQSNLSIDQAIARAEQELEGFVR